VVCTHNWAVLGSKFKGYNKSILLTMLIKMRNRSYTQHSKTDWCPDEDTIPMMRAVWILSTRNVEPRNAEPTLKYSTEYRQDRPGSFPFSPGSDSLPQPW
jgi:hypothetical protein